MLRVFVNTSCRLCTPPPDRKRPTGTSNQLKSIIVSECCIEHYNHMKIGAGFQLFLRRWRSSSMAYSTKPQGSAFSGDSSQGNRRRIRGIVFDMDGTLTVPVIDFKEMRRRVGITEGDILDVINSWPSEKRAVAFSTIAEIELQALNDLQLMPGIVELCEHVDRALIPRVGCRGLITRNVQKSIEHFHTRHFPLRVFHPAISREAPFAHKPSPEALLHICSTWGISPGECMMIGDSAKDDVVCGNRAGAVTVLLDTTQQYTTIEQRSNLVLEATPHIMVNSLSELAIVLQRDFELLPPA